MRRTDTILPDQMEKDAFTLQLLGSKSKITLSENAGLLSDMELSYAMYSPLKYYMKVEDGKFYLVAGMPGFVNFSIHPALEGKIKKWNPKTPGPDASLTGKLTLSGSGNLGISDVVSAGLGVKGVFTMRNEFAVGQETYSNRNLGKRDPAAKKKRLKNQAMLSKKENMA